MSSISPPPSPISTNYEDTPLMRSKASLNLPAAAHGTHARYKPQYNHESIGTITLEEREADEALEEKRDTFKLVKSASVKPTRESDEPIKHSKKKSISSKHLKRTNTISDIGSASDPRKRFSLTDYMQSRNQEKLAKKIEKNLETRSLRASSTSDLRDTPLRRQKRDHKSPQKTNFVNFLILNLEKTNDIEKFNNSRDEERKAIGEIHVPEDKISLVIQQLENNRFRNLKTLTFQVEDIETPKTRIQVLRLISNFLVNRNRSSVKCIEISSKIIDNYIEFSVNLLRSSPQKQLKLSYIDEELLIDILNRVKENDNFTSFLSSITKLSIIETLFCDETLINSFVALCPELRFVEAEKRKSVLSIFQDSFKPLALQLEKITYITYNDLVEISDLKNNPEYILAPKPENSVTGKS